jgi:predicted ATPase
MEKKSKLIALVGGPGSGKSTVLQSLENLGFTCFEEVSREVTLEAKKAGIDQFWIAEPILFSRILLNGRIKQHEQANQTTQNLVFLDRGIPDVLAYLDYIGDHYPQEFIEACHQYRYDKIFFFPPWQEIYRTDNERYESFREASEIGEILVNTYKRFGYELETVPFGTIDERIEFITQNS